MLNGTVCRSLRVLKKIYLPIVSMYVSIYVCIYVCMYLCMYLSMYVSIYVSIILLIVKHCLFVTTYYLNDFENTLL